MVFGPLEGVVGPLVGALASAFLYQWPEISPKGRVAAPPIETLD